MIKLQRILVWKDTEKGNGCHLCNKIWIFWLKIEKKVYKYIMTHNSKASKIKSVCIVYDVQCTVLMMKLAYVNKVFNLKIH